MIDRLQLIRTVRSALIVKPEPDSRRALLLHLYDFGLWHEPSVEALLINVRAIRDLLNAGRECPPAPPPPRDYFAKTEADFAGESYPHIALMHWREQDRANRFWDASEVAQMTAKTVAFYEKRGRANAYPRIAQLRAEFRPHYEAWAQERWGRTG